VPKPNYGFEKRQKELAKQRKKEDKLKARADRKAGVGPAQDDEQSAEQPEGGADQPPPPPQP
jgi:hypothetical protein